jgi:ATP-dependent DNA ligase
VSSTLDLVATAAPTKPHGLAQNAKPVSTVKEAVGSHDAVMEAKLDGWRLLIHVTDDGTVEVYSRSGNRYTGKLPHIEAVIAEHFPAGTWLDGEAVAITLTADGRVIDDWGKAQTALTKNVALRSTREQISYHVFDLIAYDGGDFRRLPFRERRAALEVLFPAGGFGPVQLTPQLEPTQAGYDALVKTGYEGAMVKHLDACYASGARGAGWFKLKAEHTVDCFIIGFKDSETRAGCVGSAIIAQCDDDGNIVERGHSSGMDDPTREAMTADRAGWIGTVVEIKFNKLMKPSKARPHGAFRHPDIVRVRYDKLPHECLIDNGVPR